MENPRFLQERFSGLAKSPEVAGAAHRMAQRTGEEVPKDPNAQIQNYLNRFGEIVGRGNSERKGRSIKALKQILTDRYVVRVEDIPERYWQAQMNVVRERGQSGDWQQLTPEEQLKIKQEHLAQTKEDQKGSLEEWVDYLASEKSSYLPDYLKYWAFQGMLRLERYKKGGADAPGRFPERPTGRQRSVKMFPEVNERALKFIAQAYEAQSKNQSIHFRYDIPPSAQTAFTEHLKSRDFRLLYGWGQEYIPPISEEEMNITEGEWITYAQGSDPKALAKSLQGKGSGWCIAGEQLARQYLSNGNLSVYYTRDREGSCAVPRVVVVQNGSRVTEVRGIEWEENVDSAIKATDIIGDKLKEIPGGEAFYEIDQDTKRLTAVDKKISSKESATRDDLMFLYEVERPIKYFGYQKDPRIAELRASRNHEGDMQVIFECAKEQIAHTAREINENTKAYVGALEPGIFDSLQKYNVEHIYASFPEEKVERRTIKGGTLSKEKLKRRIEQTVAEKKMQVSSWALSMFEGKDIDGKDFATLEQPEDLDLVRISVQGLGFPNGATTKQIYDKAESLGLELCPAETGPQYRLQYMDQPMNEIFLIAMKQIAVSGGYPRVFGLDRNAVGLWLYGRYAHPEAGWAAVRSFVFRLRPPKDGHSKYVEP